MSIRPLPLLLLLVICALAPILSATPADAAGATLQGQVHYKGTAPPPEKLTITKDPQICGKTPIFSEQLLVSAEGGLANAVIWIEGVPPGPKPPPQSVTLSNQGCRYEPHVLALTVGSEIKVANNDPVLHNTHARFPKRDVFNIALPMEGQVVSRTIDAPGLIKVACDAGHEWMSAWIAAFDHPWFAISAADGSFSIPNLPPGDFTLVLWHEKLGRHTQPVTVSSAGATVTVELD